MRERQQFFRDTKENSDWTMTSISGTRGQLLIPTRAVLVPALWGILVDGHVLKICTLWSHCADFGHLYSSSSVSEMFNPGSPSLILNRPTSAFLFIVLV